jgi:hypothetical protein
VLKNRLVKYAKLHQNLFIPGIGDLTTTLPPVNKSGKFEMRLFDSGLLIDITVKGVKEIALIPYGNIAGMVLAAEEAKKEDDDDSTG